MQCEGTKQSRMSEKFMSGIEEGRLDKLDNEACLLLYPEFPVGIRKSEIGQDCAKVLVIFGCDE